jgi:hypothetical protein
VGRLENRDKIMKDSFFIGVYPGIDEEKMNYILDKVGEFMGKYRWGIGCRKRNQTIIESLAMEYCKTRVFGQCGFFS